MIKIFIDQGHNPENPNAGAEGNGLKEQDINYEVGVLTAARFNSDSRFEAKLSRPTPNTILGTDNYTSLKARVDEANSWGANWFISIHANASTSSSASGTESYVYSAASRAYGLGEAISAAIAADTGLADRGVFIRPTLYVLRKTAMPAVLVELGFITNSRDAFLMSERPSLFAQGIYEGTAAYTL